MRQVYVAPRDPLRRGIAGVARAGSLAAVLPGKWAIIIGLL